MSQTLELPPDVCLYGNGLHFPHSITHSLSHVPPTYLYLSSMQVEAFRDFRTEAGGPDAEAANAHNARLAEMFKPPADLIFPGDFEKAKAAAAEGNRWIMINVQSNSEFASHQLNRDTWSNDTLKELIRGSFVFLQVGPD